jgi:predicted PurR-regulated permease PerM
MPTTPASSNPRNLRNDIVFAFALAIACYLAWFVRDVLMLVYVSALFAVVLTPLVRSTSSFRIRNWRPFKGKAVLVLLLVLVGALVAFCYLALPPVIHDLQTFGQEAPARLPGILDKLKRIPLLERLNDTEISGKVQDFASNAATYLLTSIKNWVGILFNVVMGFILTVYFILEGDTAYAWFLSFFPPAKRDRLDQALRRAELRMGKWLVGQAGLMLVLGISSTIVFLALHVRYAYALGVLAGALNIIPVIGAAFTIALALLVAAIDSWGRVLGIAIFYLIYLQVENAYLTPRIMRSSVNLPGLAILISLLLGSELAGIPGAMVSVPTAVLVSVLVDEFLVYKSEP